MCKSGSRNGLLGCLTHLSGHQIGPFCRDYKVFAASQVVEKLWEICKLPHIAVTFNPTRAMKRRQCRFNLRWQLRLSGAGGLKLFDNVGHLPREGQGIDPGRRAGVSIRVSIVFL